MNSQSQGSLLLFPCISTFSNGSVQKKRWKNHGLLEEVINGETAAKLEVCPENMEMQAG